MKNPPKKGAMKADKYADELNDEDTYLKLAVKDTNRDVLVMPI